MSAEAATFVQGKVQNCDAVQFIKSMHLRDPRVSPQFFPVNLSGLLRLSGHGVIPPCDADAFFFDMLEVHTDGSAVLQNGWPAVPISAGWGAVLFCSAARRV